MKISILGINGFLSTAIAQYCNKKNYNIEMYGIGKPKNNTCDACYQVDFVNEDLNYSNLITSDVIFYTIGAGIQSNLKEGTGLIYNLNVSTPVKICCELRNKGYNGIFITFGSYFELGESNLDRAVTEDEILNSTFKAPNDYAVSKRMLTKFISSYERKFVHWHFILPTIYGAGENPTRLIPDTVNSIKEGKLINYTSGDQIRQYIHVTEIPRIVEKACYYKIPGGIYNIGGNECISVKELVLLLYKTFNKDSSAVLFGSASRVDISMKYLCLDGSKLYNQIYYRPTVEIKHACKFY